MGVVAQGACSLAFPANGAQCSVTADCSSRGEAFHGSVCVDSVCVRPDAGPEREAGHEASRVVDTGRDTPETRDAGDAAVDAGSNNWACLGHVGWPDASPELVTYTAGFVNLITNAPIPGVRVEPCSTLDPTCSSPLAEAGLTNDAGLVSFAVPFGYNGYLRSDWDAALPSLIYAIPPAGIDNTPATMVVSKLPFELFTLIKIDGGVSADPSDGTLFLSAYDCLGNPASGVIFTMSPAAPSSTQVYVVAGVPEVGVAATDPSGEGAIVNIPPAIVTITGTVAATHQTISKVSGYVEAGSVTYLSSLPSP